MKKYDLADFFALFGLAFALCGMETWRVPRVAAGTHVPSSVFSASDVLVLVLVCLALAYWLLRRRLTDNYVVLPAVSFLAAGAIFCYLSLPQLGIQSTFWKVFSLFHASFSGALFALWIEVALSRYTDRLVTFVALTFAATFFIQMAYTFLGEDNLRFFTVLIPLLSAVCFAFYRSTEHRDGAAAANNAAEGAGTGTDSSVGSGPSAGAPGDTPAASLRDAASGEDAAAVPPVAKQALSAVGHEILGEEAKLPRSPRKHPTLHYAFLFLAWMACGVLFAMLFRTWYNSATYMAGEMYTEIHLFTALGTLVAAVILLVLSQPVRRGLIEIIIVMMALAAVLFSNMGTQLFVVYLIPLNTAQKLIFVSLLRSASEFDDRNTGMAVYCMLLAGYRLGLALQSKIRSLLTAEPFGLAGTTVDFLFYTAITAVLLAFFVKEIASLLQQAQRATREAIIIAAEEVDAAAAGKETRFREGAFHYYLMQKFELTQRESEVLRLFESGATVKQIAEEQVVSESTVKTHLSNVYPKLSVRSRREALRKIQTERENFFRS